MSAINLKSITGITSITTPAGIDNQLTLHTNDTTQRVKVTQSGIEIVGVSTFQDIDVDGHTSLDNVNVSGTSTITGVLYPQNGIRVPDDIYSYFGTGNDLSIRHHASGGHHSYIFHHGAGAFKLGSDNQMILGETTNRNYIEMNPNSDVKLFFNNAEKLATSNTGVTVTGSITATGTIETTGSELKITGTEPRLTFTDTDNNPDFQIWANAQKFQIYDSTNSTTRLLIKSNGDVEWNGIGTQLPGTGNSTVGIGFEPRNGTIFLSRGDNATLLSNRNNDGRHIHFNQGGTEKFSIGLENSGADLAFNSGTAEGTERLRITSDGKVGVNQVNPYHVFEVVSLGNDSNNKQYAGFEKKTETQSGQQAFGLQIAALAENTSGKTPTAFIRFDTRDPSMNGSHGSNAIIASSPSGVTQGSYGRANLDFYVRSGGTYTFLDDPSTSGGAGEMQPKLRIDSSGRVMIGTTTPGYSDLDDLTISTAGNTGITIRSGTSSLGVIGFADGTSGNTQYRGVIQYSHSNDFMQFNTADAERLRITSDGNIGFNRVNVNAGDNATQTQTSTPNRFVFNNHYSNGYTDASLKLYLFNDGNTRHGFTSGPEYDLQYHSSGAASSKHTFYTQNNKDMHIEAGQVYKPRQYQFLVESNGASISGSAWNKLTGLSIDSAHTTGISDGTNWSNTNQRFTAPVTGTYKFFFGGWSSINSGSNNHRYATCFRINSGSFKYIFGGSYSGVDTPLDGTSIVYKLSANDYIELWYYSALSGTWGGGHRVFWGGYLLG